MAEMAEMAESSVEVAMQAQLISATLILCLMVPLIPLTHIIDRMLKVEIVVLNLVMVATVVLAVAALEAMAMKDLMEMRLQVGDLYME